MALKNVMLSDGGGKSSKVNTTTSSNQKVNYTTSSNKSYSPGGSSPSSSSSSGSHTPKTSVNIKIDKNNVIKPGLINKQSSNGMLNKAVSDTGTETSYIAMEKAAAAKGAQVTRDKYVPSNGSTTTSHPGGGNKGTVIKPGQSNQSSNNMMNKNVTDTGTGTSNLAREKSNLSGTIKKYDANGNEISGNSNIRPGKVGENGSDYVKRHDLFIEPSSKGSTGCGSTGCGSIGIRKAVDKATIKDKLQAAKGVSNASKKEIPLTTSGGKKLGKKNIEFLGGATKVAAETAMQTGASVATVVGGALLGRQTLKANSEKLHEQSRESKQAGSEFGAAAKKFMASLNKLEESKIWEGKDARKYIDSAKDAIKNIDVIQEIFNLFGDTSEKAANKVEETQGKIMNDVNNMNM